MHLNIDILLLGYFAVSILIQALFRALKKPHHLAARIGQLLCTAVAIALYLFSEHQFSYLHLQIDQVRLWAVIFCLAVNSGFQLKGMRGDTEPLMYNLLNLFSFICFASSDLMVAVTSILAIKIIDIIISFSSNSKKHINGLLHQFLRLNISSLVLLAFLVVKSLPGDLTIFEAVTISQISYIVLFAALVIEGGLLTLRMAKRIELESIELNLIYPRLSSINFSTFFALLFLLNGLQDEVLHPIVVFVLIGTLLFQAMGLSQITGLLDLIGRVYLINLSFVVLIFSSTKEPMVLLNCLVYAMGLHLVIPMVTKLIRLKDAQEKIGKNEAVLLMMLAGWLTLLPLPSSFFTRVSLMILSGKEINAYFFACYILVLALAFYVSLHKGREMAHQYRPIPPRHKALALLPHWTLLIAITFIGTFVGTL